MLYQQPAPVCRAALIPYVIENGQIQMMFMKPSDTEFGGDSFQLAKGKVEDEDATKEAAAIREAKEELGLFVGNVISTDELGTFMGRTTVYIAKVRDKDMFGEPSYETSEVAWMTPEQFESSGRELHRPVIRAAVRRILFLERAED